MFWEFEGRLVALEQIGGALGHLHRCLICFMVIHISVLKLVGAEREKHGRTEFWKWWLKESWIEFFWFKGFSLSLVFFYLSWMEKKLGIGLVTIYVTGVLGSCAEAWPVGQKGVELDKRKLLLNYWIKERGYWIQGEAAFPAPAPSINNGWNFFWFHALILD